MIYDLEHGFFVQHIPRTGFTSVTTRLAELCPRAVVDVFEGKHRKLRYHFQRHPELEEAWPRLVKICGIRQPWDIFDSFYRHALKEFADLDTTQELRCTPEWVEQLRQISRYSGIGEFVNRNFRFIRPDSGFWGHYCLGVEWMEMGVEPVLFSDLNDWWTDFCRRIGIDDSPLPVVNKTDDSASVRWHRRAVDAVTDRCHGDIRRFGFKPPELV